VPARRLNAPAAILARSWRDPGDADIGPLDILFRPVQGIARHVLTGEAQFV
jgi:hypothetical protein